MTGATMFSLLRLASTLARASAAADPASERHVEPALATAVPRRVVTFAYLPAFGLSARINERVGPQVSVLGDIGAQQIGEGRSEVRAKTGMDLHLNHSRRSGWYVGPRVAVHSGSDQICTGGSGWLVPGVVYVDEGPRRCSDVNYVHLTPSALVGHRSVSRSGFVSQLGLGAAWQVDLAGSGSVFLPALELRLGATSRDLTSAP